MITKILWLLATFLLAHVQLATAQHPAKAQPSRKFARVGYLSPFTMSSGFRGPFRQQLYELGYVEGKNIAIETRAAEGSYDRLGDLADELVRLQVDAIFVDSNLAARAAKEATGTIPIVVYSGDLLGTQFVTSLARPGGNITGVTNLSPDLSAKRLELLRETLPRLGSSLCSGTQMGRFLSMPLKKSR
jgi:putative ABC transport system substrate-binding protein